jgi:succinyl-CoA synthetase alpha subunit
VAILVDDTSRVLVQGITGREGAFHTARMLAAGTQVVAGVSPGKGGQSVAGVPVFDSAAEAVAVTGANTSVIFVPARFALDALYEAGDAGVELVVCITEGIPVRDMVAATAQLDRLGVRLIGPNCPGVVSAGLSNVGNMPARSAWSRAAARLPTRSSLSWRALVLARRPVLAWVAMRCTASVSSTVWSCLRPTRRRRRWC